MELVKEGKVKIKVEIRKVVSRDMPVFYNPVMELNRTISILLLNCLEKKEMQIALPMAGSGIRAIRFVKELNKGMIKSIWINDNRSIEQIEENLRLNNISINDNILISNTDANIFLLNSCGFDYIDIDPFGSPNPFLDAAVKRISRNGIIAVTATDTSALCGTNPKACLRKYWARPLRNEIMHETGLRILIRKCQLIGAQYDKSLMPIYSYSKDHYMRIFFRCEKGKKKVDEVLNQHGHYKNAGALWLGQLWDKSVARKIYKLAEKEMKEQEWLCKFLRIIMDESKIDTVGFFHIPSFAKRVKVKSIPKQNYLIDRISEKGFRVSETHFAENSIRTDIPEDKFLAIIKI